MKNLILFFLALIVAPSWAGDVTIAPVTQSPLAHVMAAAIYIDFQGSAKSISALIADLEKEAAYKTAGCSPIPAKKSAKPTRILCAKADGALLTFLSNNGSAKIRWSISEAVCPTGCTTMNCPPPGGAPVCCKKTATGYKAC